MIVDARRIRIQPDRIGIGNEMDLVAARGQFHSQFGGDDAAAAVGGIASDADVHLAQRSKADLPVQVFIGRCHVAAAEPHADRVAIDHHGRVADHFGIPRLRAAELRGELRPAHAVGRAREAQAAVLGEIAAGVEHPVEAVRLPDRRLADAQPRRAPSRRWDWPAVFPSGRRRRCAPRRCAAGRRDPARGSTCKSTVRSRMTYGSATARSSHAPQGTRGRARARALPPRSRIGRTRERDPRRSFAPRSRTNTRPAPRASSSAAVGGDVTCPARGRRAARLPCGAPVPRRRRLGRESPCARLPVEDTEVERLTAAPRPHGVGLQARSRRTHREQLEQSGSRRGGSQGKRRQRVEAQWLESPGSRHLAAAVKSPRICAQPLLP